MPEFDLIRKLQEIISLPDAPACLLGIGDDAAVLEPAPGRQLVVCTDTLVEGVHFPVGTDPRAIGHKSLAVNLSDLAAMGAEPDWFLLALTLPDADEQWLAAFASGMGDLAARSGIALVGGDTTHGPLSITVTAAGSVAPGTALTRSGARSGDLVAVSGCPGRAAQALAAVLAHEEPDCRGLEALEYPEPRLALGKALCGLATACIDLSDGLLADLGHILAQSGVGAELDLGSLPESGPLAALPDEQRWQLQLGGGDDYELCFTVPARKQKELAALALSCELDLSVIGEVTARPGLVMRRPDGSPYDQVVRGYEHFAPEQGQQE
jgi:thiamine-monophosphate kinase